MQKFPVHQHFRQNVPTNVTLNIKKPSKLKLPKSQLAKNLKPAQKVSMFVVCTPRKFSWLWQCVCSYQEASF